MLPFSLDLERLDRSVDFDRFLAPAFSRDFDRLSLDFDRFFLSRGDFDRDNFLPSFDFFLSLDGEDGDRFLLSFCLDRDRLESRFSFDGDRDWSLSSDGDFCRLLLDLFSDSDLSL